MQQPKKRGGNAFPECEETLLFHNVHHVLAEAESTVAPLAVKMLGRLVLKNLRLHSGADEPKWIGNHVANGAGETGTNRVEFCFAILHTRSPHHILDLAINWKVDCVEYGNADKTDREAAIHAT